MGDGHGGAVPADNLSDGFFVADDGDGKNDAIQPCETPVDDCPKKPVLAKPSVTESTQCLRATPLWFNFNLTEKVWIPGAKDSVDKMWSRNSGITKVLTFYYGNKAAKFDNDNIIDQGDFGNPDGNLTNYLETLYDKPADNNNLPALAGIDENSQADDMDYVLPPNNGAWKLKYNAANIGLNSIRPFMGLGELSFNMGQVVKGFTTGWKSILYYNMEQDKKPFCLYSQFNQYNKSRANITSTRGLNFAEEKDLSIPLYPILVKDYKTNDNTNGDRYLAADIEAVDPKPPKSEQDVIDEELEPLHTQCWYGESEIMVSISSDSGTDVDAYIDRVKISVGVGMYMTNDGDGIKIKPEITDNEGNIDFDAASKMAAYINVDFGGAWVDDNGEAGNYAEFIKDIGSKHEFAFTFDEINKKPNTLKLGKPAGFSGVDEFTQGFSQNQQKGSIRDSNWLAVCSKGLASLATWSSDQMITDKNIIGKLGVDNSFELHYWRIRRGYARFSRDYSENMNVKTPPPIDGIDATYQTKTVSFIDSDGDDVNDTVLFEIDKENLSYNSYREADGTIADKIGILIRGIIKAHFTHGVWQPSSNTAPLTTRVNSLYRYGTRAYKETMAFGKNNGDYGLFVGDFGDEENIQLQSEGVFLASKKQMSPDTINPSHNPACMYYYGWSQLNDQYALDIYSYMHRAYLVDGNETFDMLYLHGPVGAWGTAWDSKFGAYKIAGQVNFKQGGDETWPSMSFPVISYSNKVGQDYDEDEV